MLVVFDHFAAWSCCFRATMGTILVVAPVVAATWSSLAATTSVSFAVVFAAFLFSRGYRISIQVDHARVLVEQHWLRWQYRVVALERATVTVDISGTGDWGFPGDWPIAELCEVRGRAGNESKAIYVGPAGDRQQIAQRLRHALAQGPAEP